MNDHHDSIGCEEIQRLICERSERTLSLEEAETVADAIERCEACKAFFRKHDEVLELFVEAHEAMVDRIESRISDDFTDRVLAKLPNLRDEAPVGAEQNTFDTPFVVRGTGAERASPGVPTTTTTPEPHARGRGSMRRFPLRAAMAAAAILILAVIGLRFLSLEGQAKLQEWSGAIVRRTASATTWHPVADNPQLADGDTLYVCPNDTARLELADAVVANLGGDTMVELLAAGPRVRVGIVSVDNGARGPHLFTAGSESVEVTAGTKAVIRVDAPIDGETETTVWVRDGAATIRRDGRDAVTLAAGENRVFAGSLPPHRLPQDELTALRTTSARIDRGERNATFNWIPSVGANVSESAASAIAGSHPYDRATAITVAGRLGFAEVVDAAPDGSAGYDASYRRALVVALARTASPKRLARIERLLDDEDPSVRAVAADALGALTSGSERAAGLAANVTAKLRSIATSDKATVHERLSAAVALTSTDRDLGGNEQAELAAAARHADAMEVIGGLKPRAFLRDAGSIRRVAAMMVNADLDVSVREQAYTILKRLRDPSTAPSFLALLGDPVARMRKFAMTAIRDARLVPDPIGAETRARLVSIALGETGADADERCNALLALSGRGLTDAALLSRIVRQAKAPARVRTTAAKQYAARSQRPSMRQLIDEIRFVLAQPTGAPVAAALIGLVGQFGTGAQKANLIALLDHADQRVANGAISALSAMNRRSIAFADAEVNRMQRVLRNLPDPAGRRRLRRLIASHHPKSVAFQLLQAELERPKTRHDLLDTLRLIGNLALDQAVPQLVMLLEDDRDVVAATAANTLATLGKGSAASAAIPHILKRYRREIAGDPHLDRTSTFDLARALLTLGEVQVSLRDFTRAIHGGWIRGGDAAEHLHRSLAVETSSAILVQVRDVDDPTLRHRIARLLFDRMSGTVVETVRRWYHAERDPWTRFILAGALMKTGTYQPIAESLIRYRDETRPSGERMLVSELGVASFDEAIAAIRSGEKIPSVTNLLGKLYSSSTAGAANLCTSVNERPADIDALRTRYVDRIRGVRRDLRSTDAVRRAAAATRAASLMDRALLPVLIHLLTDEDVNVRRASARTLASVSPQAIDGYSPSQRGSQLREQVRLVRERFDEIDLTDLIDRPLALRLDD